MGKNTFWNLMKRQSKVQEARQGFTIIYNGDVKIRL